MYHKVNGKVTSNTPSRQVHSLRLRWYAVHAPSHRNPDYRELKDGDWVLTYDTPDGTPLVAQYSSKLGAFMCAGSGEHLTGISSYVLLPSPDEVEMPSLLRR
jgi:hypothetical protein